MLRIQWTLNCWNAWVWRIKSTYERSSSLSHFSSKYSSLGCSFSDGCLGMLAVLVMDMYLGYYYVVERANDPSSNDTPVAAKQQS